MMKIAIMQPYFFPYVGYFQLIASVDRFVILDDVNYINRGWINRNRIWNADAPTWITVPLQKASQNRMIREIDIQPRESWQARMRRSLAHAYARAPWRDQGLELFDRATGGGEENLSEFLSATLRATCEFLSIDTEIIPTSSIHPRGNLSGPERIIDICLAEGADAYLNPPGGRELYDAEAFERNGIKLGFQEPDLTSVGLNFSSSEGAILSILDLVFLNPAERLAQSIPTAS